MQIRNRRYKSGSGFAFWRWTNVFVDNELYLTRLHIIQIPKIGAIMIHWIKKPDSQPDMHDHPVSFLSIILSGWYIEIVPCLGGYIKQTISVWNFKHATDAHRITETPGVVTLVFASPKKREWGFYTQNGWVRWQDYNG